MTTSISEPRPTNVRYGTAAMEESVAAAKHPAAYQAMAAAGAKAAGDWHTKLDNGLGSALGGHRNALRTLHADLGNDAATNVKSIEQHTHDLTAGHAAAIQRLRSDLSEKVLLYGTAAAAVVRQHIGHLQSELSALSSAADRSIATAEANGANNQGRINALHSLKSSIASQKAELSGLSKMSEHLDQSNRTADKPEIGKTAKWFNDHAGILTAGLAVAAFIQAASLIVMAYSQRQIKAQGEKHEKDHVDSGLAVESEGLKARNAALQQATGQSPIPSNNPLYAGAPASFSAN